MADPNVFSPQWDLEFPDPRWPGRMCGVARHAGAKKLGATVYEFEAGGGLPYHAHSAREEMLVVLSGSPEVRTPEGRRMLEPGTIVSFPPGDAGAHQILNPGPEPARVLMVSTMEYPDVAKQLDVGNTIVFQESGEVQAFPPGVEVPFFDAMTGAMEAGDGA
jgi:uncharacterized cupin superfamily protein